MHDLRLALRNLWRAPGDGHVAVLTLALSLGAVTAIFTVAHGVLLRPLPFAEPDRLVRVINHPEGNREVSFEASHPDFLAWQQASTAFEDMAGFASSSGGVMVDFGESLGTVDGYYVSWNLFSVLGVPFLEGRAPEEGEDQIGAAPGRRKALRATRVNPVVALEAE